MRVATIALLLFGAASAEAQAPRSVELARIGVGAVDRREGTPRGVEARIGEARPAIEDCAAHGGSVHARWVPEAADLATITIDGGLPRDERRCILAVLAELDIVPAVGSAGFYVTLELVETAVFEGEVIALTGHEDDSPGCGTASVDRMVSVAVETVLEGSVEGSVVRVPVSACGLSYARQRRELVGHRFLVTVRSSGRASMEALH